MTTEKKRFEAQQQVLKDMHSAIMAQTTANEAKTKLIDSLLNLQCVMTTKEEASPPKRKPDELRPNTLRPEVQWFAEQMELKLRKNHHKGGWSDEDYGYLIARLRQEVDELAKAVGEGSKEDIAAEAADVGNFALMIADNARTGRVR